MLDTQVDTAFDSQKADAFAGRVMRALNDGAFCLMASIGHRTGLFDAMKNQPPSGSAAIAARAGLNERYVREWLAHQAASGYVEYGAKSGRFTLPPEHAFVLANPDSPAYIVDGFGTAAALSENMSAVMDAFRTGQGVQGNVDRQAVALGNAAWMQALSIDVGGDAAEQADRLRGDGATVMYLAVDGALVALIAVADRVKDGAAEAIRRLHAEGLRIVMLTGDHALSAQAIARGLGIDEVHADVSPADKAEVVRSLKTSGRHVAMAGDGINDAPALAVADVGIAMGTGTDVAMESAQVTLVKGDLAGIVRARALSRATVRNIHQNLFFAFVYNGIGVPLAAGALYPWLGWMLSPMVAALAMSVSSVSVVGNALRLRRVAL